MRILVHDYSGHPFQAQLSRELASRGHSVRHAYCASYISGKGRLERSDNDPDTLSFTGLTLGGSFDKYSLMRRLPQERAYAKRFVALTQSWRPELVLMCNVPLVAHALIKRRLLALQVPTVFWHQDVYSHAIGIEARRRLRWFGAPVAGVADRMEAWIARNASAVIAISDQFLPVHQRWGTDPERLHIIPNWGPVWEIYPQPRDNDWATEHRLVGRPVLLYSGTLGLKHDASQLLNLLRGVRARLSDTQLVVVSDGPAAEQLRNSKEPGLTVLPFQPFDRLAKVLSAGDVLLTILQPEASDYSVPSKTLTYLCVGRPVVALLPRSNPAYEIVAQAGGIPVDLSETDIDSAAMVVASILADQSELDRRGKVARAFAETSFDISRVADRFEAALGLTDKPLDGLPSTTWA